MVVYLENLVKEWLLEWDSDLHNALREVSIEEFADEQAEGCLKELEERSKRFGFTIEPEPTEKRVRDEIARILNGFDEEEEEEGELTDAEVDCLLAIQNGNCARDCLACPIHSRL